MAYLRNLTKSEIIAYFREALKKYADENNWSGDRFIAPLDINTDDCSGFYKKHGQLARTALHYNENARVTWTERKREDKNALL